MPQRKSGVGFQRFRERRRCAGCKRLVRRVNEARADIGLELRIKLEIAVFDLRPFLLDLGRETRRAEFVNQDLDTGLVDVVAAAIGVVRPEIASR